MPFLTGSIVMGTSDYLRVARPTMGHFATMPETDGPKA